MADRLKAIWSGFEGRTSRRLSGRGVDGLAIPARDAGDRAFGPLGGADAAATVEAPARAALAALRLELAAKAEDRARSRKRARSDGDAAPVRDEHDLEAAAPEGDPTAELRAGLHATDLRVRRRDLDYAAWNAADARRQLAGKRKKFFGLF